jgi:O-antigen/teichoic acid export membrane protein
MSKWFTNFTKWNQFFQKKKKGFFFLNVPNVVNVLITVITLPILLRSLSLEAYGQWQYVLAFQSFAVVFTAAQTTSASKRGIALNKAGTFYFALKKRLQLALIPSLLFLILAEFFLLKNEVTLGYLCLMSIGYLSINNIFVLSLSEYYIAKQQFARWSLWQIMTSTVSTILGCVVAIYTKNILFFVLSILIYTTGIVFIELVRVSKRDRLLATFKARDYDDSCFMYGLKSLPNDSLGALSLKLADIIIANTFGYKELAIFSVAQKIRNVLANVLKMLGPLTYVEFAKQKLEFGMEKIKRSLAVSFLGGTGMAIVAVLSSSVYISFFLPAEYQSAILYVFILALSIPFVIPTTFLYTFLDAHLRYRAITFATVIPNIIKILLILFFGYTFGLVGFAIALSVHMVFSFLFFMIAVYKKDQVTKWMEKGSNLFRPSVNLYD